MRILLDECVPRRLRRELSGHDVHTVAEMGWSGKKNGELLQVMAAQGFEVLLTADQRLRHQQDLQAAGVAVIVLVCSEQPARGLGATDAISTRGAGADQARHRR